jgi:AsmA-like C-terminal region
MSEKTSLFKKILKGAFVSILVLLIGAIAAPFLFKDKILAKVKTVINENVNAKVDFKEVDISVWRHFPSISFGLKNLNVLGINEFDGVKLLGADNFDITMDFWSVWSGGNPYRINSIHLDKPYINVVTLSNGNANYLITKPDTAVKKQTPATAFKLNLNEYSIKDGHIIYDDRKGGIYTDLDHLNHNGSGDLATDLYDLKTHTDIKAFTCKMGNMTYLSKAKANLDAKFNVDMKNMKFTLKDNSAQLNDMKLNLDGWLQLLKEDIKMDFKFNAPSNDFKNLLSIIPGAYTDKFKDVKTSGKFKFDGFVKGTYNGVKNILPVFSINTLVENGQFQYPSLPLAVTDIHTDIKVLSPSSNFDEVAVDVPKFHIKLGTNPFDAVFHLRTPMSDPDVDMKANGILNLADLSKAFPMENIQNLNGLITANLAVKTRMSYIDKKQYEKVNMAGGLKTENMNVAMKDMPAVFINAMSMNFTPNNVKLDNFDGKLGKSDLRANGTIDNILAYFSPNRTMTGNLTVNSNFFDANEWMKPTPAAATPANTGKTATDVAPAKPFDRFDFTMNGQMNKILYEKYDITSSVAKGHFTPSKFLLSDFATTINGSDVRGNGVLNNVFNWMFDKQTLSGELNVASNYMDLNQFMTPQPVATQPTTAPNTATEVLRIPHNMDLVLTANMKKVLYTNLDLSNLTGKILVKDQTVRMEGVNMNTLGGAIGMTGGYDSKPQNPKFDFAYNFKGVEFQKSFNTFNTFQKLAPIGQYINGKFNNELHMTGELGKDMMPNLNALTMDGFLHTVQAVIAGFKPLEEIGNKLNMEELKRFEFKDTKNWLEVKNGNVIIKEFDQKVKDIAMKISGTHSLTNEMNYIIKAKIPRKLLEKNPIGSAASSGFNVLLKEAGKYGVNIQNSAFVNVQFNLTGSSLAPKVAMKVLGGDGQSTVQDVVKEQANAVVNKAKDSVATRANQELDKLKEKAKLEADKAVEAATQAAKAKVEEAKAKAAEELKKRAGEVVKDKVGQEVGKKVDEQLQKVGGDKLKTETDKLKSKLDQWDPFGKKKPQENGGNN